MDPTHTEGRRDPPSPTPSSAGELADAPSLLADLVRVRSEWNRRFFGEEGDRVAALCHRMAERFARDGRLIAVGGSPAAVSDARHVAVEFVHPVIVGKRALPALALTPDGGPLALQVRLVARPDDIVMAFAGGDAVAARGDAAPGAADALAVARERGCLTVAFEGLGAEWELGPGAGDPFVRQELVETLYHVLWELVHVFFDHPGLLEGGSPRQAHDVGGSSFLYPFLGQEETDLEGVLRDVRASVRMKAGEVGALRERTVARGAETIHGAAAALRRTFDRGGTLLAFGNGGSATDAMDVVADFRAPIPPGPDRAAGPARSALDLTADSGILTAISNDVGNDLVFARQIIAYGRRGDVALGLSTSGNSRNVVRALGEARRRGLATVALVGYDGGRVADEGLADHVIVAPSEHIPRIQEAHATVYHLLRELAERAGER